FAIPQQASYDTVHVQTPHHLRLKLANSRFIFNKSKYLNEGEEVEEKEDVGEKCLRRKKRNWKREDVGEEEEDK
nr:hypothetical protein [Tanacetum cinerariifolium]